MWYPCLQHEELREKLRIVRTVLEQGGQFSGINRKARQRLCCTLLAPHPCYTG
jgi:hypothetical protein